MLETAPLIHQPSVQVILEIWTNRYRSVLPSEMAHVDSESLAKAASTEGRKRTATALRKRLVVACERAALQTSSLFSKLESLNNHVNLGDARRVAKVLANVYGGLLDVYEQQQSSPIALGYLGMNGKSHQEWVRANMIQPSSIEQLINALEPLLLEFQKQNLDCRDNRTVGFMSTQFHLGTQILLERLSPAEQGLLLPYLRFVEEQVCIPWQRVCAAAAKHSGGSPLFEAALTLLPLSQEISEVVYQKAVSAYPKHLSRRGYLDNPAIAASSLRDHTMFQAYFWLSVLESSPRIIEEELLPLCTMVYPSLSVDWELVEYGINTLLDEILDRLSLEHQSRVQPYAVLMKSIFTGAQNRAIAF
ncbi:MAG: hypothetical protein AAFV72_01275 [Cyanobacteria bacterium J06635_1]